MARRSWDVAFRDMSALHWLSAAADRDLCLLAQKLASCNSDLDKWTTTPPFIRWEIGRVHCFRGRWDPLAIMLTKLTWGNFFT